MTKQTGITLSKEQRATMRAARKSAKLSQAEMAAKVGVAPNHFSQLERGEYRPGAETLAAWADALGFDTIPQLPVQKIILTQKGR